MAFLKEDEMRDALLVVYANKMDLPHALSVTELASKLEELKGRKWHLQPASAVSGDGLLEALDLADRTLKTIKSKKKETCYRILLSIVPFF